MTTDTQTLEGAVNHAQECDASHRWVQTYKAGRDEDGNIPAFEFMCELHHKNFWLAVPNLALPPAAPRDGQWTQEWLVIQRVTNDGYNVVVHDGLHIGPFEKDKADAIVRDHNACLNATPAPPPPADALRGALEKIAAPKLIKDGSSTTCLRCGIETFHEKDGELQHEPDCAQQIASAALSTSEENE